MREIERYVILQVVDSRWREHLDSMDYLRDGIHLRAMAQKDPLVEYRAEGHMMFEELRQHDPRGGRADALPRAGRGATQPAARAGRAGRTATSQYQHDTAAGADVIAAAGAAQARSRRRRRSRPQPGGGDRRGRR